MQCREDIAAALFLFEHLSFGLCFLPEQQFQYQRVLRNSFGCFLFWKTCVFINLNILFLKEVTLRLSSNSERLGILFSSPDEENDDILVIEVRESK